MYTVIIVIIIQNTVLSDDSLLMLLLYRHNPKSWQLIFSDRMLIWKELHQNFLFVSLTILSEPVFINLLVCFRHELLGKHFTLDRPVEGGLMLRCLCKVNVLYNM